MADAADNPLDSPDLNDPNAWDRLIELTGPASMLVVIASRMSDVLGRIHSPEDIWSETLYQAFRSRDSIHWKGQRAFRRWLLDIAENRIRDIRDRDVAKKRGGGAQPIPFDQGVSGTSGNADTLVQTFLATTTTPSRVASRREEAAILQKALGALPKSEREIVQLRLFEELTMPEIAAMLNITVSAARHRFSTGLAMYRDRLAVLRSSRRP